MEVTYTYPSRPVSFKLANGKYLSAEDGGGGKLLANSSAITDWEIFRLITLQNGKVVLRAPSKEQYLNVRPDGYFGWVGYITEWATLDLVALGDGKVALKTHHGKYISVREGQDGIVIADGSAVQDKEILELIEMESNKSLWQIGKPGNRGKLMQPGSWQEEFSYNVGSDNDPVNAPQMPFVLVQPGKKQKPQRQGALLLATDKLNIRFTLDRDYGEGELTLVYDFMGSETDTLLLDGNNLMKITGIGEGKLKNNQIPLGALAQGEHTLTITTEGGTGDHPIDYLQLLYSPVVGRIEEKPQEEKPQEEKPQEKKPKEKKDKTTTQSPERRVEKPNTIIVEFGTHKKDDIRDLREGRGRLIKRVGKTIAELQKTDEVGDSDLQPIIVIVKPKKSKKDFWDRY